MRHPEQKEDEFFMGNSKTGEEIGWKNKRLGRVAYDISGNVIKGLFPIFVSKEEVHLGVSPKLYEKMLKDNE